MGTDDDLLFVLAVKGIGLALWLLLMGLLVWYGVLP